MDKNIIENTLPFVLQSCGSIKAIYCSSKLTGCLDWQWSITSLFEPLKVLERTKSHLTMSFSSEEERRYSIITANAMRMILNNPPISMTLATYITTKIREEVQTFIATPPSYVQASNRKIFTRYLGRIIKARVSYVANPDVPTNVQ
jgi:hypothetical protein